MKRRIAMWAGVGFLVAGFWFFYTLAAVPPPITSNPIVWTLIRVTCPIVLASFHFHLALGVYESLVANAATYALVGLIVETLRRTPSRIRNAH
jgi:hypothetical protein